MNTRSVGRAGEEYAVTYLKNEGHVILDKNWNCYAGEIDIVARKDRLIFVEVKFVRQNFFGSPHELFTYKKQLSLMRSINKYLVSKNCDLENWRLDLICLARIDNKMKLNHYKSVSLV